VLYLLSLPVGWKSWRDQQRRAAALESGRELRQHVDHREVERLLRQRHVSAECWCAVKRPGVAGDGDRRADPRGRSGDLLGDRLPLGRIPTLGTSLQRDVESDEHEGRKLGEESVRTKARDGSQ